VDDERHAGEEFMSVSGVNGAIWSAGAINSNQVRQVLPGNLAAVGAVSGGASQGASSGTPASLSAPSSPASGDGAVQAFESYFRETPAQRMQEAWLRQHGISQQQYNNMSAAEKQKVAAQMNQDIQTQLKQKLGTLTPSSTNILV
jgi:hypothetical protein